MVYNAQVSFPLFSYICKNIHTLAAVNQHTHPDARSKSISNETVLACMCNFHVVQSYCCWCCCIIAKKFIIQMNEMNDI